MPKTKFESIVFTLIMVFCMVYCMTTFTISVNAGGFDYPILGEAIREMWLEYVIVFCLAYFIIAHAAQKLAFRFVTPGVDKPIFVIVSIQCMTVCLMVPTITLIATFIHNGFTGKWLVQWISLIATCFPMALCLQLFLVGPFVRFIFRSIFRRGEAVAVNTVN